MRLELKLYVLTGLAVLWCAEAWTWPALDVSLFALGYACLGAMPWIAENLEAPSRYPGLLAEEDVTSARRNAMTTTANINDLTELFGEVIHAYTREQALEDGALVDVTEWASADKGFHGGFTAPVAITRALWAAIEAIPASRSHEDVRGRAHDVLWMASIAARRAIREKVNACDFGVILPHRGTRKRNQRLRMVAGPGDAGELVITIGFPADF